MKGLIGILTNKWVVQFIGLLALALLIWFAGPLLSFAGNQPLDSELERGFTIAGLFVAWLIFRLVMHILAGRKEQQLMSELAAPDAGKSVEQEASEEELETLKQGFEEALSVLRQSRAEGKSNKQSLYELPWYVIIGAPGSGKTTALVNSGLKFPLAEKLGKNFVKGVSGTRNCDWWFTDEAVLLDTAGRYTTQDSHQAVDASAWQNFLQLVKKHRPRRPLNGVLVTLSLSDLLQQTEEERGQHAQAVRRRVLELYETLGVRLPIYMLFTKTDLVAGFTDFFADFSEEDRRQVWGETFPAEDQAHPQDRVLAFASAYDELLQRLNWRTLQRVQEERDIQRRSLILDFPQQMALLKPGMVSFLQQAFAPNRFEQPFLLRGIYFTSGTQEGTPIDRIMGILAGAFKLDRQSSPMYSGRGKSFFLTRLLKDVVFPESELAGADPRVEKRQQLLQIGALAGASLLTLGLIGLWTVSYGLNRSAISQTEKQIEQYQTGTAALTDARSNFKQLLPKLDTLSGIKGIWDGTGFMSHLGLYQGRKIEAGVEDAYEDLLKGYFLPTIVNRLRDRLAAKPDTLLLKTYLMLGQPERRDPKVVEAVVRADWELAFNGEPDTIAKLSEHLHNLLQLDLPGMQLDQGLVAAVRAQLTQIPQETQCYESFKAENSGERARDFRLAEILQPNGPKAFAYPDGKDKGFGVIPALFTGWGYGEVFLKKSLVFVKGCMEENWVLNIPSSVTDPREIDRLHEKVKLLYLRDYQKAWSGLLAGVKLQPAANLNQTIGLLDVISAPDSPLKALLLAVEKNTALTKISSQLSQLAGKALPAADEQTLKLLNQAKQAAGFDASATLDPVRVLENTFEPLNALVRGEPDKPLPLDAILAKAKGLRDYFMQSGGQLGQKGVGADIVQPAKMEFAKLPEPVRGWLLSLTNTGATLGKIEAEKAEEKANKEAAEKKQQEGNKKLKELGIAASAGAGGGGGGGVSGGGAGAGGSGAGGQGGGSQCKAAFSGRYPFVKSSPQDVPLADFNKFFAPNGVFDQFFQATLKDMVDTSQTQWRQKPLDGKTPALSPVTILQFQLAAKIRDAFYQSGASPAVQFDLKPLELDANADSFRLIIEGQEITYRHGVQQVTRIQWPGQAAGSGARIVFERPDKTQAVLGAEGPWAMFRLFDKSALQAVGGGQDQFQLTFQAEGLNARFELRTVSVNNPFTLGDAWNFRCPESI